MKKGKRVNVKREDARNLNYDSCDYIVTHNLFSTGLAMASELPTLQV